MHCDHKQIGCTCNHGGVTSIARPRSDYLCSSSRGCAPAAVSKIEIPAGIIQACKTAQGEMVEAPGSFALREASRVAKEGSELSVWGANVPELDALVHGCSGDDAVVVFAPVCRQDLKGVRCHAQCGPGLPQVPDLHAAIP